MSFEREVFNKMDRCCELATRFIEIYRQRYPHMEQDEMKEVFKTLVREEESVTLTEQEQARADGVTDQIWPIAWGRAVK